MPSSGKWFVTWKTHVLLPSNHFTVDLNWDGIASITESGIVTKAGEALDFDVIVFGTGFDVVRS
jgi:hypothetical protein